MNSPREPVELRFDPARVRRVILQVILLLVAVIVAAWLLYALRPILLLLALTIIFCYLVFPLIELIERPFRFGGGRSRMPRTLSVILVYLGLAAIIIFSVERAGPALTDQLNEFLDNVPSYARKLDQSKRWMLALPARYRLPLGWRQSLTDSLNDASTAFYEWIEAIAGRTIRMTWYLPWLVLIPVLGFFFLKDARKISDLLLSSFPEGDVRFRVTLFLNDVSSTLAAYIRAQLLACLLVGLIEGAGLWAMGISYPLIFAIGAGVLEFIPLLGPLILGVAAVLVVSFHSWQAALLVAAFLVVFRMLHDYLIYPRLMSVGIRMHPILVILAVLSGAELGGVVGVFLSIPIVGLLLVCWRHWRDLRIGRLAILTPQEESLQIDGRA
ncbi:MAG: AI-2E family transporter [Acidobacteriota bacterium]|nr:MAG: AI-2E family transporter [Acidobacteriota bacterium]